MSMDISAKPLSQSHGYDGCQENNLTKHDKIIVVASMLEVEERH